MSIGTSIACKMPMENIDFQLSKKKRWPRDFQLTTRPIVYRKASKRDPGMWMCATPYSGQLVPCTRHCLADVIQATAPGRDTQLQSYLRRPPLQVPKVVRPEVAEEVLTKKLVNFVSVKGEDLLLQADSENQVKFHRLRSSVPGRLWKWKTVCGMPWKHQGYHINVLEVQAVHTCLQWKICRKRQKQCRFLHLTDSLVALHALSRGRSSSRRLRSILSQVNLLLLAADVHPI